MAKNMSCLRRESYGLFTLLGASLLTDFFESLRVPLLLDGADLAIDEVVYKLLGSLDSER